MVRQARTYFAGAVSGATLIGAAIALFVVLVSAQVFHHWPIAALGFGHDDTAVAPAKSLGSKEGQTASAAATTAPKVKATRVAPTTATSTKTATDHGPKRPDDGAAKAEDATGAAPVVEASPVTITGSPTSSSSGSQSSSSPTPSSSGQASSSGPSSNAAASSSSAGGSDSSSSSSSGGGAPTSGSSSSGGGSTSATQPVTETVETVTSAPANVAAGVNETVNTVDEKVLGGTLKEAGVTEVTESVVNGVAGPESTVGKTVAGVGETVNGLLGGGSH